MHIMASSKGIYTSKARAQGFHPKEYILVKFVHKLGHLLLNPGKCI
jgi:hypothetical protein